MKRPCKNCPFKKDNKWHGGAHGKIMAFTETVKQGIFSCHAKHPDRNIFSVKPMDANDCVGFAQMKENRITPDINPKIVNGFNETLPDYDLHFWLNMEKPNIDLIEAIKII